MKNLHELLYDEDHRQEKLETIFTMTWLFLEDVIGRFEGSIGDVDVVLRKLIPEEVPGGNAG